MFRRIHDHIFKNSALRSLYGVFSWKSAAALTLEEKKKEKS
jgi:hypothetical protein